MLSRRAFHLVAVVCALLGVLYYAFFVSGMYVSSAKFAVRGGKSVVGSDIMSLLGGFGGSLASDSYIVAEYIQSIDMLKNADAKLHLRPHYSDSDIDFLSRLKKGATLEEFVEFWESVARVSYDSTTGIISVETRAYTPQMARDIAAEIIVESEELMNRMNDRVQNDTVRQARKEMGLAESRYSKAKKALTFFRATNSDIDPHATAANRFEIIAGLEGQISMLMVELETQKQFLKKGSVQVRILEGNLAELRGQLALEKARLTGDSGPEMLNLLEEYEKLSIENEFARNYYINALAALESTRIQSESKSVYLEAFQYPTMPEEAAYPDRLLSSLLVVVVVGMGYALLLLILAAVREHIGV